MITEVPLQLWAFARRFSGGKSWGGSGSLGNVLTLKSPVSKGKTTKSNSTPDFTLQHSLHGLLCWIDHLLQPVGRWKWCWGRCWSFNHSLIKIIWLYWPPLQEQPITQSWNLFLDFVFLGRLSEATHLMDRSLLKSHPNSSQSFWWKSIEKHYFISFSGSWVLKKGS